MHQISLNCYTRHANDMLGFLAYLVSLVVTRLPSVYAYEIIFKMNGEIQAKVRLPSHSNNPLV